MFNWKVAVVLASVFILSCDGRSYGAPMSACSSMTPIHHSNLPQRSQSTYSVSHVRNEDKIRVEISSPIGEQFQGFILQARSSSDRNRIVEGTFTQVDGVTKATDCFNGTQNTLTHVSSSTKREVVTDFTPRSEESGDIIFRATVAKTFDLFWTGIDSPTLTIGGDRASREQDEEPDSNRIYQNCFVTKGCLGWPSGCIDQKDCEVFLSYYAATDGIVFKISSSLEPLTYMAMGLSNDNIMGDDLVTECLRDDSDVVVRRSWNDANRSNGQNRELPRDKYSTEFKNGLTTCSWTADFVTESNGRTFDLVNSTYHLLLSQGPIRDKFLSYHGGRRIATHEAVNFTVFEKIEEEGGVTDSVQIHDITGGSTSSSPDENTYNTEITEAI